MKTVKLVVNGKEIEGMISETVVKLKRRRKIKDKEYTWDDYKLIVYIPKAWRKFKKFIVIPADNVL